VHSPSQNPYDQKSVIFPTLLTKKASAGTVALSIILLLEKKKHTQFKFVCKKTYYDQNDQN